MDKPDRILIVRTDRLGDVILSTPVIANLRKAYPQSHIAFMCRPYTARALLGNPYLDEVIIYDKYGKHKGVFASIKFSLELRNKKFDWVIILHPTNRAHIMTFFAKIPFRVGWNRKARLLLSKRIPHTKQEGRKHELEYSLDILRSLGISTSQKGTYFPIPEQAREKVKKLLRKKGLAEGQGYIVIHPSASCPSKRWPQNHFLQLVKLLREKIGVTIVMVTARGEERFGQKIAAAAEIIDLRGQLDISEVGALLKEAALFISNDSGPVHIAASFNTPTIAIFGRKSPGLSPERWKPSGEKSFYFYKDVGCKKCAAHSCAKNLLCLRNITPQEVAEKAIAIYQKV